MHMYSTFLFFVLLASLDKKAYDARSGLWENIRSWIRGHEVSTPTKAEAAGGEEQAHKPEDC